MKAASTAVSPTVRNNASGTGAPPMMRTAMYVQYVPMPKLAQPKAKLRPSAWRGVASRHA